MDEKLAEIADAKADKRHIETLLRQLKDHLRHLHLNAKYMEGAPTVIINGGLIMISAITLHNNLLPFDTRVVLEEYTARVVKRIEELNEELKEITKKVIRLTN